MTDDIDGFEDDLHWSLRTSAEALAQQDAAATAARIAAHRATGQKRYSTTVTDKAGARGEAWTDDVEVAKAHQAAAAARPDTVQAVTFDHHSSDWPVIFTRAEP